MAVEIKPLGFGVTQVVLTGSLDVSGAAEIEPSIRRVVASGQPLIIDMAGVSFVSSQGVRVIVAAAKALAQKGFKTVIVNPRPEIRKVFRIMNLEAIIPIFESYDEAGTAVLA